VRRIDLGLYGVAVRGHDHKEADTMLGAQMSAPIAAGLALVDGAVTVKGFERTSLGRAELREAIGRVDVRVDEECERQYPKRRSGAVRIELADGRALERRVLDPKGEGENPLADADLEAKFRANCEPLLGRDGSEAALDIIWHFRSRPAALADLLAIVAPKH
jgi:2-methylcitrate dehydratase PrpD